MQFYHSEFEGRTIKCSLALKNTTIVLDRNKHEKVFKTYKLVRMLHDESFKNSFKTEGFSRGCKWKQKYKVLKHGNSEFLVC